MGSSNFVHVRINAIIKETDKAFLVAHSRGDEDNEEEIWIPKSQIADADDYEVGDTDITLSVTEFIAKEKNLEVEE